MEERIMIINVPCNLDDKIYYIGRGKVEQGEFRGVQYYAGLDHKEPRAYLSIHHRKQGCVNYTTYPNGTHTTTYNEWDGSDLIQPNLSSFNKTWFLSEKEAETALV
jgi:hypothetical protein